MRLSDFFTRTLQPSKGGCFVLMPFAEGMQAVYEHGIKPFVEDLQMQCRRGDEMYSAQGVLSDIWNEIQTAEIIIADLTRKNPNVMYELGLCHSIWKKVILLSQNKDDVPFDLRAWRVIWYDFTFAGAARLKDELQRAINSLRAEANIEAEPKPLPLLPNVAQSKEQITSVTSSIESSAAAKTNTWQQGTISTWKDDTGYGFIKSGGVDFFARTAAFFHLDRVPAPGDQVIFQPGNSSIPGKPAPANHIFLFGTVLRGYVSKSIKEKGFGFVEAYNVNDARHNLFALFGPGADFEQGDHVEFVVSANHSGPIGREVVRLEDDARDSIDCED